MRHWAFIVAWFSAALASRAWTADSGHALSRALQPPSLAHPFGFDAFGRDLLVTVLRGSLDSALFAGITVAAAVGAGITFGSAIALAPPRARFALLRSLDFLLAFPSLLLALAWAAIRGPSIGTLLVSLLLGTLPSLIRLMQLRASEVLAEDYVLAARSIGAGPGRILTRHLFPAVASLCRIKAPGLFAHALMAEATLSFLGIGAPIGRDTWGTLLAQSKEYLLEAPHLAIATGLPLVLTILSLQLISESPGKRASARS